MPHAVCVLSGMVVDIQLRGHSRRTAGWACWSGMWVPELVQLPPGLADTESAVTAGAAYTSICKLPPTPTSYARTPEQCYHSHDTHVPGGSGLGSHVVRRNRGLPPSSEAMGSRDPERHRTSKPGRRGVGCLGVPIGTPPTFRHFPLYATTRGAARPTFHAPRSATWYVRLSATLEVDHSEYVVRILLSCWWSVRHFRGSPVDGQLSQ